MATISKATVCEIKEYGQDIKEYILKLDKNNYFEPGSFLLLSLEEKEDYTKWPDSRNFSIASVYNKDAEIRLIIRKVGEYTTRIFNELTLYKACVVKLHLVIFSYLFMIRQILFAVSQEERESHLF